ncbi:MAG: ABC transporter ATP-binding protein [Caldilinea sp.]|uniref:ABC transporter ATP-binding protein n=1 Tax=Caldilinea sp. TaxID=2293560 RepID=UPI002B58DCB3|nr:ABC transporter ATP-binding protein [Anaerolineales bacterium]HQY91523.1 ABC transporter ATP-binding protein [Caldilinea sp.]
MAETEALIGGVTGAGAETGLIVARNVHKRYGRKRILNGVELTVPQGKVMALLGANGAGKSTLMRIISGLATPDRGEVRLGGVSTRKAGHEIRRYIGLVAHAPLLYDNLSAWDNLMFYAQLYDIQQPAVRVEAVLHAVELWTRRHDVVRTYSRGMTQRLAIGRAILHDPPVLLLDEPDTGLDPASAETLARLIRTLGASSRAILLTTHNLERAVAWADSVSLLADGKIVQTADAASLTTETIRQWMVKTGSLP